jgi:hypothetical protein
MKFKTLRKIDTKEFVHIYVMGATLSTFTGEMPSLMTAETTFEGIREYYGDEISPTVWDNLELVELNVNVSEDTKAEVQLKLEPFKRLLSALKAYDTETNQGRKFFLRAVIISHSKYCEKSIEYFANML